jgi:hypothetical protein
MNHPTDLLMSVELTVFSLKDRGPAKNRDFTRFVQVFSRAPLQNGVPETACEGRLPELNRRARWRVKTSGGDEVKKQRSEGKAALEGAAD